MSRRKPSSRHAVTVEIGTEKHTLRSDAPPEYTRACAAHLDETLRALPGYRTLEPHRAVILAALAITDELFRTREDVHRLREEVDRRAAGLAAILEGAADGLELPPPEEEPPATDRR